MARQIVKFIWQTFFDSCNLQNIPTSLTNDTYPSYLPLPPLSHHLLSIIVPRRTFSKRTETHHWNRIRSPNVTPKVEKPKYRMSPLPSPITRRHSSLHRIWRIFFYVSRLVRECEQRVDDVTSWWFPAGSYVGGSPKETAKKVGTMVSAKRVHRVGWRETGWKKEREGEEGRGKRSGKFCYNVGWEILPSVESIMPASDSFSRFFFASTASAFRFIGLSAFRNRTTTFRSLFFPFLLGRVPGRGEGRGRTPFICTCRRGRYSLLINRRPLSVR